MTYVVVTGLPGSGKTTLARALAAELDVALLSKDDIQEALMDTLGTGDIEWARTLSRTAHGVMQVVAAGIPGTVVMEAHFHRGIAEPVLTAAPRSLVQVWCSCPVAVAWDRYQRRRDDPDRHPGHRPDHQDESATRGWRDATPAPLALDAPLVVVDTSLPVDVSEVAHTVRGHLGR